MRISVAWWTLLAACASAWAQNEGASGAVDKAVAAMENGDLASAEQTLRSELRGHPNEAPALEVLAAVLDQQNKYAEADPVYRRALALDPRSPGLLNNYGNHLVSTGRPKEAQAAFLKVLALDPHHPNALLQAARIALAEHDPAEASRCLARLPAEINDRPDVLLLRMLAAYQLHRAADGDALLGRLADAAKGDARRNLELGEALSAAALYDRAETFFNRALELEPDRFETLYDLGLAAAHAGHNGRAREALEQALAKQPDNADVLYDLAAVDMQTNRAEEALELLGRARRIAPDRPDAIALLARDAGQVGYFGDAVKAWDEYLKLRPHDAVARRERAFAEMAIPENEQQATADLQAYARAHPDDPIGHYELGAAESAKTPQQAVHELTRALSLKPDFASAHLVRGLLVYRQGDTASALPDFEKAAEEDPENAIILGRLGQAWLALERPDKALPALQKAARIAPGNAAVQLQLGRALSATGKPEEAARAFARYRELNAKEASATHPAGLVDFLSLSPQEQFARYRAGVERTVEKDPNNAEAQVRYLGLLLADGKTGEAETASAKIAALEPGPALLEEAARQLLDAGQYSTARDLLGKGDSTPELKLDLAIATAHVDGTAAALAILDQIPADARTGDYYLARIQFQDASAETMAAALRAKSQRPDLYRSAATVLLQRQREEQAVSLLNKGVGQIPDDPGLRILKALAATLEGQTPDEQFRRIEDRWPESSVAWLAQAFALASRGERDPARRALENAKALGAAGPAVEACEKSINAPAGDSHSRLLEAISLLFG